MNRILTMFLPIIMTVSINSTAIKDENDTFISETAYETCVEYGEQYNICPELLMAIIERESAGKPDVENGSCKGLMQISVKWHSDRMERLGVTDIFDERSNILVGADYLAELFEKYEDTATVLMIYHGERNAVQKVKRGEISGYARWILERREELEEVHERLGKGAEIEMFEDTKLLWGAWIVFPKTTGDIEFNYSASRVVESYPGVIVLQYPHFTSNTYSTRYFEERMVDKEYQVTDILTVFYSTDKEKCVEWLKAKREELLKISKKNCERLEKSKIKEVEEDD